MCTRTAPAPTAATTSAMPAAPDAATAAPPPDHPRGRGDGGVRRIVQAAVGEGVRGHVEDPHDPRAVQDDLPRPVLPRARLRHEAAIRRRLFSPLRGRGTLYPGKRKRPHRSVLFLH